MQPQIFNLSYRHFICFSRIDHLASIGLPSDSDAASVSLHCMILAHAPTRPKSNRHHPHACHLHLRLKTHHQPFISSASAGCCYDQTPKAQKLVPVDIPRGCTRVDVVLDCVTAPHLVIPKQYPTDDLPCSSWPYPVSPITFCSQPLESWCSVDRETPAQVAEKAN